MQEVKYLQNSLRAMLTWFLSPQSCHLDRDGEHIVLMLATQLSAGYRNLNTAVFDTRSTTRRVPSFRPTHYQRLDALYFQPLLDLYEFVNERMSHYVSHFFLHGSLATRDYSKGWSDVDTLVVVSKQTITDPIALKQFRELCLDAHLWLLAIDPLQHHGFIIVTDLDLEGYPSTFLPPAVLDYAVSMLSGADEITFKQRESHQDAIDGFLNRYHVFARAAETGLFGHHAYRGEYLKGEFQNAHNGMYQFKYFLESIMNLPAYFLEIQGAPCYKRDSFTSCRPLVPQDAWTIIEKASDVRRQWSQRQDHPYQGNAIPKWVQELVGPQYLQDGFTVIESMAKLLGLEVAGC